MGITLHYFPTPNGHKVAIALEEMGLAYQVALVNILAGGQDAPEFRAICPNGRIPALVDETAAGRAPKNRVVVFESGAILQYLGRKSGMFYPAGEVGRAEVDSWIHWQMSGLGPMLGQVNWFARAALKEGRDPVETSLALHRYRKECARLFGVLEGRLAGRDFICGDYSLADMACWPWVEKYYANAGDIADYPAIAAWRARAGERPAVQRALLVGTDLVKASAAELAPFRKQS